MPTRDTIAHVCAVFLALLVVAVTSVFEIGTDSTEASIAVLLLVYGLCLGGAHLFLGLRLEDGIVPVESRWRFLTMLTVLFVAAIAIVLAGDRTVAFLDVRTVALGAMIATAVGYVLVESVSGYRSAAV